MTLILSGTNGVSDVDGSASTPAIRGSDTNTGIFFPAADTIAFAEGGAEVARFDSSGNLGIGTSSPTARLDSRSNSGAQISWGGTGAYDSAYGSLTWGIGFATIQANTGNALVFSTNGNNERARIDSSGNLLVGTTSRVAVGGANGANTFSAATSLEWVSVLQQTTASPLGLAIRYATDSNGTANEFVYCVGNATLRMSVRSNGGIANYSANNVNLSDARLKTDFQPAPSYYERWKQIDFITYLYKDQTDTERNLGVTAQQLETVCPELIDNSGFGQAPEGEAPYKAVYQTDFQYATAVALQEAIKKIDELKAELDTAKARIAALEAA